MPLLALHLEVSLEKLENQFTNPRLEALCDEKYRASISS
jgi:hypothetical protein